MTLLIRQLASHVLPSLIPALRARDFRRMRAHERYPCCAIATLELVEQDIQLEGLVLEASLGGLLFREALSFIYDRRGESVRVHVAGLRLLGEIVNVHARGYGLRLAQELTPDELRSILDVGAARPS
jgi:hypothetical protein